MDTTYYFPWIRKGLSNCISEKDTLGVTQNSESLTLHRPKLFITPNYNVTPASTSGKDTPKPVERTETKDVQFISPGDITKINKNAIVRVVPKEKSDSFPIDYLPYIEFYEPDFPWRYSPVQPNSDKLRPWLAILVCKNNEFVLEKNSGDRAYISLNITNNDAYKAIFLSPEETWKTAHAQGNSSTNPIFSRLLSMRREQLEPETEYTAFLIPLFETGRLRGLGFEDDDMETIVAQASSWEKDLTTQKQKHPKRPLDFPVYHHWTFKTGMESFDALAERLTAQDITKLGLPADIQVNVTDMGEGLSYSQLPVTGVQREVLGVPVATVTISYEKGKPYPSEKGVEAELYRRMKDLISKNPVLVENISEISGGVLQGEQIGDDDPWVSPPIYGGKHAMATSIETKDNKETPWIPELNLDVHNRVAAGMGKKIVQNNQEEFVNRAWKQVEAVNALNQELRQRLLSSNANSALKKKTLNNISNKQGNTYIALLMKYLDSLKYASTDSGTSLAKILNDNQIPLSFATATFHQLTSGIEGMDETALLERISSEQIFRMKEHDIFSLTNVEELRKLVKNKKEILKYNFYEIVGEVSKASYKFSYVPLLEFMGFSINGFSWIDKELDVDFFKSDYSMIFKKIYAYNESDFEKAQKKSNYLYVLTEHLKNWHNEMENIYIDVFSDAAFSNIHYFFKNNKHLRNYSGNIKGQQDKTNVIAIPDDKYEELFGSISKSICTKIGKEDCLYFVPQKAVVENIKEDDAITAYIKFPYMNMPYVENHKEYEQIIGNFKLLWKNNKWIFEDQDINNGRITFEYKNNSSKFDDLFIAIRLNKSVINNKFNTANDLKNDFFGFPILQDENKNYLMKYRLSSYYNPVLNPFELTYTSIQIQIEFLNSKVNRYFEDKVDKNVIPFKGFHYPIGCYRDWGLNGAKEERSLWGGIMEFIYARNYKSTTRQFFKIKNKSFWGSSSSGLIAAVQDAMYVANRGKYESIRNAFLLAADPKSFKRLFRYYLEVSNNKIVTIDNEKDYHVRGDAFDNMFTYKPFYDSGDYDMTKYYPDFYNYTDPKNYGSATLESYSVVEDMIDEYDKLKQKSLEYLFTTPDHFEVDIDKLKEKGLYQEFETAVDYTLFKMSDSERDSFNSNISNYNSLLKMFELFEALLAKIDTPVQTEEVIPSINQTEIEDIKSTLFKNEGYEKMVQVAQSYYSEFFANTAEGKKLRDKYVNELLHSKYPIMAYPIFPEPTYYYLREMSEKFILPCVEQLPEDSIALFKSNSAFEEAYLCGMNTEMGKELLWREYPTDQRGSYFRKFWDSETSVEDIRDDNFFDIKTLHHWKNPLGGNHNESKSDLLIFAIKGKLIKQYPSTLIYLHKAVLRSSQTLDFSQEQNNDTIILPELTAWVSEDTFLVGFKKELAELVGNSANKNYGYFLAFKEDMLDINFAMFNEAGMDNNTAGNIAAKLVNTPSVYGKHVSLFV